MTDPRDTKAWLEDFSDFMEAKPDPVPSSLEQRTLQMVSRALNPSPVAVFFKAGLIQIVVGFISLLFCPQFGLSLTGIHGIMHFMMQFGERACMFGCGTLFAGSSLLFSSVLLTSDEVRTLRKHEILQVTLLSLLALGSFLCLGAEIFETVTLLWLAGSVLGGIGFLELGWVTRRWIRSRVMYG